MIAKINRGKNGSEARRETLRNFIYKYTGDDPEEIWGSNWENKLDEIEALYLLSLKEN